MSKEPRAGTRAGKEILGALREIDDALKSGEPIERRFKVRSATLENLDLAPRKYTKDEIHQLREKLGVSQAVFARFFGVDIRTVQSWEQGLRTPSGMACRFLDEVATNTDIFNRRLKPIAAPGAIRRTKSSKTH